MPPDTRPVDRRDKTHIRPLTGAPPELSYFTARDFAYGRTMRNMQTSGFHRWGYVVIRTASYNDDNNQLWEPFLAHLRAVNDHDIPAFMLPLLTWDVLEDRDLEGAGVEAAIRRFSAWRAEVSVERDGEGADDLLVRVGHVARFRYFVMVDDESLASLREAESVAKAMPGRRRLSPVKVRVVDAGCPEGVEHLFGFGPFDPGCQETVEAQASWQASQGDGEDGEEDDDVDDDSVDMSDTHSPVEGCTSWDVGWMWVRTKFLLSFSDILQADQGWSLFYERPPKVY